MKLVALIEFLRRNLRTVIRVAAVVLLALVVVDALPGVIDKEHAHTSAERWPGFWAVFGVLGCAFLIIASKAFGHLGIMTREDYYDE